MLAQRPATAQRTYGFHRAEILAALTNGAALRALAVLIGRGAWERLAEPPEVRGALMLEKALGGAKPEGPYPSDDPCFRAKLLARKPKA